MSAGGSHDAAYLVGRLCASEICTVALQQLQSKQQGAQPRRLFRICHSCKLPPLIRIHLCHEIFWRLTSSSVLEKPYPRFVRDVAFAGVEGQLNCLIIEYGPGLHSFADRWRDSVSNAAAAALSTIASRGGAGTWQQAD